LEGSPIWTPNTGDSDIAYINFCVRLDLWFGNDSINFLENDVSLALNMTSQEISFATDNLSRTDGSAVTEAIDAEYAVEACHCTTDDQCVPDQFLTQGQRLYICIKALTKDVFVDGVNSLTVTQSDDGQTRRQDIIVDGSGPLALVTQLGEGGDGVESTNELSVVAQLFSDFFDRENPTALTVSGYATIAFRNDRRRKLAVRLGHIRTLNESPESPFDVEVKLKGSSDVEEVSSSGNVLNWFSSFMVTAMMSLITTQVMQ